MTYIQSTPSDILGLNDKVVTYRVPVIIYDNKHSPTIGVRIMRRPPTSEDVANKRITPSQGHPTQK